MMDLAARRALSRGTLALLFLPFKRYAPGFIFFALLWSAGWALPLVFGKPKLIYASLAVHGYVLMFSGLLSAMVWVSVCRPETQILPGFRRAFALVWALYALFGVLLPGALAAVIDLPPLLTTAVLATVLSTAIAGGSGVKWAAMVWLLPLLLGIWPEFGKEVWIAVRESTLAPLLLIGLAILVMRSVWRRLMLVSDGAPTLSPADINASDLSAAADAARIRQAGPLAVWLQKVQYGLSATAFEGALASLRRGRSGADRRALSLVLMPNAHWRGMLFELAATIVLLGVLVWMIGNQRHGGPPMGMVASYVGLLTAMRFQGLHRATLMLRPSLVDVYLATAPRTRMEFTSDIVRALYRSLGPSMVFAATLLGLVAWMFPAEQRPALIVGGLVGALGSSLNGLAMVLMQLDAERPRMLLGLAVLGVLGSIPVSLCVAAAMQSPQALGVVGAIVLAGCGGFLAHAHRQALRWPIVFDPPL